MVAAVGEEVADMEVAVVVVADMVVEGRPLDKSKSEELKLYRLLFKRDYALS